MRLAEYAQFCLESSQPMRLKSIVEMVCRVYGQQIFVDGVFHGDPHPGNFLITKEHRLQLLDFGQCKILSDQTRRNICSLIVAMSTKDESRVGIAMRDLGFRTKTSADKSLALVAAIV